jgi:hypothetical protein
MKQLRSLSDREVHARLMSLADELDRLSGEAWSVAGSTALRTAAKVVRSLSTAFFMGIGSNERREK